MIFSAKLRSLYGPNEKVGFGDVKKEGSGG